MNKFVKCPFCGRTDKIVCCTIAEAEMIEEPSEYQKTHYGVVCDAQIGGCGASTGWHHETPEAAKAAWNGSYKHRLPDWILCSKAMPVDGSKVRVLTASGNVFDTKYIEGHFFGFLESSKITHWMMIPEPPKGDAENATKHQ